MHTATATVAGRLTRTLLHACHSLGSCCMNFCHAGQLFQPGYRLLHGCTAAVPAEDGQIVICSRTPLPFFSSCTNLAFCCTTAVPAADDQEFLLRCYAATAPAADQMSYYVALHRCCACSGRLCFSALRCSDALPSADVIQVILHLNALLRLYFYHIHVQSPDSRAALYEDAPLLLLQQTIKSCSYIQLHRGDSCSRRQNSEVHTCGSGARQSTLTMLQNRFNFIAAVIPLLH